MSQLFQIHPDNPQQRLLNTASDMVQAGGVAVYPTDSTYAIGCQMGDKRAIDRLRLIRQLGKKHEFTLVCQDLSAIATYAKVSNAAYRFLKAHTPGPYTFILQATHEVPRRLQNPKRKSIGIRVPDNAILKGLLETLGEPMISTTLMLPGDDMALTDPYEAQALLSNQVDLVIDGGYCGYEETTVVDLIDDIPVVVREGLGPIDGFGR